MGFTGLALGAMLARDGVARARRIARLARDQAQGQNVIWLFMVGGTSHMESFDPKPELNKHAGKTIAETPYKAMLDSPLSEEEPPRVRRRASTRSSRRSIPLQVGFGKHGQSGIEISDWWPHLARLRRRLAVVRSMWTTDNDHGAQLQFHTGRHALEGPFPDDRLVGPLRPRLAERQPAAVRRPGHAAGRLLRRHAGARRELSRPRARRRPACRPTRRTRCRSPRPTRRSSARSRRPSSPCSASSTGWPASSIPTTRRLRPDQVYELAFRMQTAVPEVVRSATRNGRRRTRSTASIKTRRRPSASSAWRPAGWSSAACASSRSSTAATAAPAPGTPTRTCKPTTASSANEVDQPIAGLLKDLKQRGLLDETLVVWATEFGRTPGAQGADGRDHHPYGFSVWLAGGGIKGGVVHGATDELGFHAVENRHYVTDIHATVLNQLGLDLAAWKSPAASGWRSTSGSRSEI